jgi:predicted DNA-binding transcriptional regulator AlpA
MDRKTLVSRLEIAHDLGVQPQTIAHWERSGWFPRPKRMLSMKRIYYDRAEVREALAKRASRKPVAAWQR